MEFKGILKIILVIIITIASFFAGTYGIDKASIAKRGYDDGYSAGYNAAWDKATKLIESSQTPIFPMPKEILSLGGIIKIISPSGSSLTMEANPVSTNPLSDDSKPTARTIRITSATKIIKIKARTPKEIQAMAGQSQPLTLFSEAEITFSQLKQGDRIIVTSDKNIKSETEITAQKISLRNPLN